MPSEFGGVPVQAPVGGQSEFGGIPVGQQGPPEQSFGEALREYGRKMNPAAMLQGFGEAVRHPIDFVKNWTAQNQQLADQAETAWKEGRHVDAARHAANYLFNMIPGVGTASDEAGNKLENGDVAGGLADSAALASQAALGIKTPVIAETAGRLTSATGAGIKAAAPGVGSGLLKAGAAEVAGEIPGMKWPARVAIAYPAGKDIAAGLKAGGAAFRESLSPTPIRPPAVGPAISDETAMYAAQPEKLVPQDNAVTLDQIAQGFKYKDFASVKDPGARQTIQNLASRLNASTERPGPQLVPPRETPLSQGNPPSGQDIIRGSSNIPLSKQGAAEAQRLAQATAGQFDKIYTSPLDRAQATARAVASTNPQAGAPEPTEALTPWYLGAHEGQPTTTVLDKMQDLIQNKPDEVPSGRGPQSTKPGQSFNDFKDEFLGHVKDQVENYEPGQKILNATHYRDTRVLQAWAKAGASADNKIDVPTMLEKGDVKPGDLLHLNPQTMEVKAVPDAIEPGIYFARHGATAWNGENGSPNPAESVGAPGPAGGAVPQPPAAEVARLNAGAPPEAAPPNMPLRNMDLDRIARTLRVELNKGTITKSQAGQIINSEAGINNLRDQLGLKGRYHIGSQADYLRRKVLEF